MKCYKIFIKWEKVEVKDFRDKHPRFMRIQKISYVVKEKGTTYEVVMTKIVGLKIRELVPVKKARTQLR